MDWEQVRISFLIATFPGLIAAIAMYKDPDIDLVDNRLIGIFVMLWLAVLVWQTLPTLKG